LASPPATNPPPRRLFWTSKFFFPRVCPPPPIPTPLGSDSIPPLKRPSFSLPPQPKTPPLFSRARFLRGSPSWFVFPVSACDPAAGGRLFFREPLPPPPGQFPRPSSKGPLSQGSMPRNPTKNLPLPSGCGLPPGEGLQSVCLPLGPNYFLLSVLNPHLAPQ